LAPATGGPLEAALCNRTAATRPIDQRAPARAMGQMPILQYLRRQIIASYAMQEQTAPEEPKLAH
jgi:hypothetical protein